MKKLLLFISTVLLFWSCTTSPPHKSDYYDLLDQSYPNQRFEKIDRAVLNLEKEDEESIASLVKAIENFAQTDWEKTRAVYVWITHNIEYDKKGLNSGDKASCKAKDVIKNRTCVCAGYANLFTALSKGLDLEAQDISGYAKGVSYREGKRPSGTNHAWNIVYIDGEAHLFDATWGAGNAQGKRRWVFDYDEFYFDTKPEEFIFSHFPKNEEYQLLDNPLTRDEFFNLPQLRSNAFNVGLTSEGLITRARKGEIVRTPTIYSSANDYQICEIPIQAALEARENYHFKFYLENYGKIRVVNGSNSKYYTRDSEGYIELDTSFSRGHVSFFLYKSNKGKGMIRYEVE